MIIFFNFPSLCFGVVAAAAAAGGSAFGGEGDGDYILMTIGRQRVQPCEKLSYVIVCYHKKHKRRFKFSKPTEEMEPFLLMLPLQNILEWHTILVYACYL